MWFIKWQFSLWSINPKMVLSIFLSIPIFPYLSISIPRFLKFFLKYFWAVGFSTLSISCILYSSQIFSFSKQQIWSFLIKWCLLIMRSLMLSSHSKNILSKHEGFRGKFVSNKIFYCHPNLVFLLKCSQLFSLPLFSKRSPIWLRFFWEN